MVLRQVLSFTVKTVRILVAVCKKQCLKAKLATFKLYRLQDEYARVKGWSPVITHGTLTFQRRLLRRCSHLMYFNCNVNCWLYGFKNSRHQTRHTQRMCLLVHFHFDTKTKVRFREQLLVKLLLLSLLKKRPMVSFHNAYFEYFAIIRYSITVFTEWKNYYGVNM